MQRTDTPSALERTHRQLISRRLPIFAWGWLAATAVWSTVLIAEHLLPTVGALLAIAATGGILWAATSLCRAHPSSTRVPALVMATCIVLGVASVGLFAVIGGNGGVLAFILLTLYLSSSLVFAWGWRAAATVFVCTVTAWLAAIPTLTFHVPPLELAAAIFVGSGVCLAIAESAARSFRVTLLHEASEQQSRRALEESLAAYRDLAESAPDLILAVDLEDRLTYVNTAFARFVGEPAESLLGRLGGAFITDHPANPDIAALLARHGAGELSSPQVFQLRSVAGPRWVETALSNVRGEHGAIVGVRGIGRDITERRLAEEARARAEKDLRKSEERYRGLIESQQDMIARFDRRGRFTFVNDAYCRAVGKSRAQLIGTSFRPLVHPDDEPARREAMQCLFDPPYRACVETRVPTPHGWRWIAWEACTIHAEDEQTLEWQAVGRDVTERRAADEALRASLERLRQSEERLRLLAQRQVHIREEERKRLGFDLHDDVCQELVGTAIFVESVRRRLAPLPEGAASDLDRIVRCLNEVVEHLRLLARDLRPIMLHDLGLEGSLRSLVEGMPGATVRFPTAVPRLGEDTEVALYRIAQEALANAARHAEAHAVEISVEVVDDHLRLEVRDDGCGFSLSERQRSRALGLVSMEERALALGGYFEVSSAPGRGTTVRVECPLGGGTSASAA